MVDSKRRIILPLFALLLLFFSVAYVSFSQNRTITGRVTSGTASINISVGASPSITTVSTLAAQDVSENTVKYVVFNFTAYDGDGAADLNSTAAIIRINRTGETDRVNSTCSTDGSSFGNYQNFTCRLDLWYFDGAGGWSINATIKDVGGNVATNQTQIFTVNPLTAITLHPSSLTWPSVAVTDTNTLSNNDPLVLNNTGNVDISSPNVEITAIDLFGEVTPSDIIYAGNFTVDETNACDAGPVMVNGTATGVTGSVLNAGNNSVNDGSTGQEQLYFCLEALNPGISSQSYSTAQGGAWTIGVS